MEEYGRTRRGMSKDEAKVVGRGHIIEIFRRHDKAFGVRGNKGSFSFLKYHLTVVKNIL